MNDQAPDAGHVSYGALAEAHDTWTDVITAHDTYADLGTDTTQES